jgi:hypothetical protein
MREPTEIVVEVKAASAVSTAMQAGRPGRGWRRADEYRIPHDVTGR